MLAHLEDSALTSSNIHRSPLELNYSPQHTSTRDEELKDMDQRYERRGILKSTLASVGLFMGLSSQTWAFGRREQVGVTFLAHGDGAQLRPRSAEQLMWEVSKRTSIGVRETPRWVSPESLELFEDPLLVWLGRGEAPPFSERAREQLNLFLRAGGLLFIDDISPPGDERFDQSIRQRLSEIWPESSLRDIDREHTLYRSFFLLDQPYGRILRSPQLQHIPFDDLSPILYARNDTFGAFGRAPTGDWLLPTVPGGRIQREQAFRFGINLVMYSTCLNYKRDQVHTLTILRRRRFQAQ